MDFMDIKKLGSKKFLRQDETLLRSLFYQMLRSHDAKLANKAEIAFALSQAWIDSKASDDFEALESYLTKRAKRGLPSLPMTGLP